MAFCVLYEQRACRHKRVAGIGFATSCRLERTIENLSEQRAAHADTESQALLSGLYGSPVVHGRDQAQAATAVNPSLCGPVVGTHGS